MVALGVKGSDKLCMIEQGADACHDCENCGGLIRLPRFDFRAPWLSRAQPGGQPVTSALERNCSLEEYLGSALGGRDLNRDANERGRSS